MIRTRAAALCVGLILLATLIASLPQPRAEEPARPKTYDVKTVSDVAYYEGDGADKERHKLDLYLPKDAKDFPVMFFVHGGAWVRGSKDRYAPLGELFAKHGIGVVATNYRLSPKVKHPEHAKDVARAFAWTHKNIATYGGNKELLFPCGHSAGGHLVALLSSDDSYLKAEGLTLKHIRGCIPISGVHNIPAEAVVKDVFPKDPEERKKASPVTHVREGLPPMLVIWGDKDLGICAKTSAELGDALKDKKCICEKLEVKDRNHITILLEMRNDDDPARVAILKFIASHMGK